MSDNTASGNPGKMHFMLWSTPPRTTFPQDMTEEERNIMHEHIAYWTDKQNQGIALVFGPVRKPDDPHGLAVIEVENADQVPKLIAEDPAVIAGLMATEFYPMMAVLPERS
ncbi:YciI family protein [Paenibacillus sp. N4]|uniref:YciI family protein n=1 Tax=Paenibacillus vietnamensis TaxID=2590547 RepID=UPI001CD0BE74|nr:YciI family protein [Paenibacillus vietnamensis]MCA0756321.1 YciI family protein [Paenibacillus vietnamensis]